MHTWYDTKWRGSLVDSDLLESEAGRRELSAIGKLYYHVTHDSIRGYDPNHLILGDRWDANAALLDQSGPCGTALRRMCSVFNVLEQ